MLCFPFVPHGSGSLIRAGLLSVVLLCSAMAGASGTKDSDQIDWKFPWWDGEWTSYSDYVFRVELKADATKEDELPHLGPKLAGNLVGRAFEAIADVDRVELRGKDGWKYLLRHLEQKRGKEKVDVLGDAFAEFFIKRDTYRREGEELGDFELRFRTMVRRLDKAIRDSGSEGRMPQEVYGWSLLHMYARMDPSDIANVRGRADSYRLEHVLSALHRMWSGGGLVMKDAEKKKKASGQTLLVDEEESPERSDTQHGIYYDEDEEDMQQELDEAAAWFHEISVAFNDSPEDPEIYASYQEARKALDKAREDSTQSGIRTRKEEESTMGCLEKAVGRTTTSQEKVFPRTTQTRFA